jgi:cellulose synthase/poly-beta-1,6-N-acetylglucosamine synthase-like glycosyltransferase
MKVLFWVSLVWVFYTYVGYLGLLAVITSVRRRPIRRTDDTPRVTMLTAAYNEENAIEAKIRNCLAQDYPREKLEIIIASDCSTDRTEEIVTRYASDGVRLVKQPERRGKTAALNLTLAHATGEILVYSDATTHFSPDTVRNLVRNFGDPSVGCVGGEPRFRLPQQTTVGAEVSLFWRYEQFLRRKESEFNTLIGVSGCVFALRRELAEPLRDDLIEDFVHPLKVAGRGYRVVYEREAVAYEETTLTGDQEFQRKTRIVVGGINALWHMRSHMSPFRRPLLVFQLFSHKLCRWLTPFFLATLFCSTLVLMVTDAAFVPLGTAMLVFAACACIGWWFHARRYLPRLFKVPYYFVLINLAVLAGIYQYFAGERRVIWEPVRS